MTPINSAAFADLFRTQFRKVFRQVGMERPREYTFWINVDSLDRNPAQDLLMSGIGAMMEKKVGKSFNRQSPKLGGTKTWTAISFGSAVELHYEAVRDEQYGTFETFPAQQARAGREREELSATKVLDRAFSTSYVGYTAGEALCGNHTGLDGTVRRNRPVNPTGFSVLGIQQAVLHFETLTAEDGQRQLMAPNKILLGPSNKFVAREILGSPHKPYTTDNELNALIQEDLNWMILHFLNSTTPWFVVADGHDMWFHWRDRPFQDTFTDPNTLNAITTAYQRHTEGGFGDWRGVYGDAGQ